MPYVVRSTIGYHSNVCAISRRLVVDLLYGKSTTNLRLIAWSLSFKRWWRCVGDYRLRVELVTWDEQSYSAEYRQFRVSSESDNFRLHVAGFVAGGNAGDSMTSSWDNNHDGQQFSTYDRYASLLCRRHRGPVIERIYLPRWRIMHGCFSRAQWRITNHCWDIPRFPFHSQVPFPLSSLYPVTVTNC